MIKILKEKTGSSIIFVLGIMLLLMAIGASALVAASANAGFVLKQSEYSRIAILDDAVHKNILYSLQHNPQDETLLSWPLVMAAYKANDPDLAGSYQATGLADIPLSVSIDHGVDLGSGNIKVESITLSLPEQNVIITPPVPAVYTEVYDEEGNLAERILDTPREPKTATVNAAMTVTVEINAKGKTITSRALYEYTGGKLADDPDAQGVTHTRVESDAVFEMTFTSDGYGKWRLIKHENVDSKD